MEPVLDLAVDFEEAELLLNVEELPPLTESDNSSFRESSSSESCPSLEVTSVEGQQERLFSPSLCDQRYSLALALLEMEREEGLHSLLDLGCNNCRFLTLAKELPYLSHLAGVDLDPEVLANVVERHRLRPLAADFLGGPHARSTPLSLQLVLGSVCDSAAAEAWQGVEAVTALELIEHLHPEDIGQFSHTVFGVIEPKLVILSTPNSDFNPLFPNWEEGTLRHWDHKFEWSREEFREWVSNVVGLYPQYDVEFNGVGFWEDFEYSNGPASQFAIFRRNETFKPTEKIFEPILHAQGWKLLIEYLYPAKCDTRSQDQRLKDELNYYTRQLAWEKRGDQDDEGGVWIKLEDLILFPKVSEITTKIDRLGEVLAEVGLNVDISKNEVYFVFEENEEDTEDGEDAEDEQSSDERLDSDELWI